MSDSRAAFSELFDFMKRLDAEYLCEDRRITEASDVAEGEHMLLHLLKAGLDVYVDNDEGRPRFAPLAGPTLKWGGEGADNPSHCAPLDPARRYVIRGNVGSAVYVSFTVYKGKTPGDWNDGVVSRAQPHRVPGGPGRELRDRDRCGAAGGRPPHGNRRHQLRHLAALLRGRGLCDGTARPRDRALDRGRGRSDVPAPDRAFRSGGPATRDDDLHPRPDVGASADGAGRAAAVVLARAERVAPAVAVGAE